MDSIAGTYAIILKCPAPHARLVGRLGACHVMKGYHIYVGSAFGPGGVRARVMRHQRSEKRRHWHVDYLGDPMRLVEAWYSHDPERREHLWAAVLSGLDFSQPHEGFGSSDCGCFSHLFHSAARPRLSHFREAVLREAPGHEPIGLWNPQSTTIECAESGGVGRCRI